MTEEKMREIAHKHALQWVAPPGSHWFPTRDTDEVTMQNVVRGEEIIFYAIKDAFARPEALDNPVAPLLRGMALALERDIQGHQKVEPAGLLQVVRTALSYLPSPPPEKAA